MSTLLQHPLSPRETKSEHNMESRTLHRPHNLNPIEGEGEWDVSCVEAGDDD